MTIKSNHLYQKGLNKMKLSVRQLLLFLVGGSAGTMGTAAMNATTAHAAVVTVKKNDTTWSIAKKHKTTVHQVVKENHLKNNGNLIYVGEKLKVHKPGYKASKKKSVKKESTNSSAVTTASNTNNAQTVTQTPARQYATTQSNNNAQKHSYSNNSYSAPQKSSQTSNYTSNVQGSELAAKNWIAQHESGGSYTARNASSGAYGKYQLLPAYLNGDYSPSNQERTADNYVKGRYGSWTAAQQFWQANGWY